MTIKIVRFEREVVKNELAFPARGLAHRKPAAGVVARTGRTVLNAGATAALREIARLSNYTGESMGLTAGVDLESGTVLLYVVDPSTSGSIVCNFAKHHNRAALHLHSIFDEHPELAVTEKMFCPVSLAQDSTDTYCLAITLKGVRPVVRRPRTHRAAQPSET